MNHTAHSHNIYLDPVQIYNDKIQSRRLFTRFDKNSGCIPDLEAKQGLDSQERCETSALLRCRPPISFLVGIAGT